MLKVIALSSAKSGSAKTAEYYKIHDLEFDKLAPNKELLENLQRDPSKVNNNYSNYILVDSIINIEEYSQWGGKLAEELGLSNQRVSSQVTPSEVTAPQNRHQGGKPQVVSLPVSDAPFTHDETQVLPPLSLQLTQMKDKSDLLAPFMALRDVVSSSTVSKSDFSRLLDLSAAILLERDARVRKEKSAVADSAALRSALDDLKLNHAALSRRHEAALRFIEQLEGESDHELTIRIQKWLEAHCHEEQIQDAHTGGIHGSYTQTVDRYYVSKERTVDLQRVQEKAKGVESQLREALRKSQVS